MGTDFVVTGTGRSGTGFTAALFSAAGVPCGHEEVFTDKPGLLDRAAPRRGLVAVAKEPAGRLKEELRRRKTTFRGDASWMAAPALRHYHGKSFLQLRHPLAVIRSFTGTKFFSDPAGHPAQHRFAAAHFVITGDDVEDAMRWWVFWNGLAMPYATVTFRLEALDELLFAELLSHVGVDQCESRARDALASVSAGVNSSRELGLEPSAIEWKDLPTGKGRAELEELACRLGYEVG